MSEAYIFELESIKKKKLSPEETLKMIKSCFEKHNVEGWDVAMVIFETQAVHWKLLAEEKERLTAIDSFENWKNSPEIKEDMSVLCADLMNSTASGYNESGLINESYKIDVYSIWKSVWGDQISYIDDGIEYYRKKGFNIYI